MSAPSTGTSDTDGGLRPMSSFRPASTLPRDAASDDRTSSTSASGGGRGGSGVVQPRPRPLIRGAVGTGNTVLVNSCQRGNPVLSHLGGVGWEYADIVPDYQVGVTSCVLFLSIRYHRLHPEYVHGRIGKLQQMYTLRVLLVLCDVQDHQAAIRELTKTALINNLTLMVAWDAVEAARYIETYKTFEFKPPDLIKERIGEDYLAQVTNVLTQVRGINRTDVVTLLSRFGSLEGVVGASMDQLGLCPGFGEVKAKRLYDVFHQPFRVGESRSYSQRKLPPNPPNSIQNVHNESIPSPSDRPTRALDTLQSSLNSPNSPNTTNTPITPNTTNTLDNLDTLDDLDDLDGLDEDQQLRLALQLSMNPNP